MSRPWGESQADHPAAVQHQQAVAALRLVGAVGADNHRQGLGAAQAAEQLPGAVEGAQIQAGGGLVQEQQLRPMDEGPRQLQAPPHAPGEGIHPGRRPVGQAHVAQQLGGPGLGHGWRHRVQAGRQVQVVAHAQLRIQARVLEHHAHAGPQGLGMLHDGGPIQPDGAVVGPELAGEAAHQRRLAAAVGAQDAEDLAGPHLEADVRQGHPVGEAEVHALDCQARGGGLQAEAGPRATPSGLGQAGHSWGSSDQQQRQQQGEVEQGRQEDLSGPEAQGAPEAAQGQGDEAAARRRRQPGRPGG